MVGTEHVKALVGTVQTLVCIGIVLLMQLLMQPASRFVSGPQRNRVVSP